MTWSCAVLADDGLDLMAPAHLLFEITREATVCCPAATQVHVVGPYNVADCSGSVPSGFAG